MIQHVTFLLHLAGTYLQLDMYNVYHSDNHDSFVLQAGHGGAQSLYQL